MGKKRQLRRHLMKGHIIRHIRIKNIDNMFIIGIGVYENILRKTGRVISAIIASTKLNHLLGFTLNGVDLKCLFI